MTVYIHALREEGDICSAHWRIWTRIFLSTPSARRATKCCRISGRGGRISIHALREEGDRNVCRRILVGQHFYPRPPRGGRLCPPGHVLHSLKFLSTPSARRATFACLLNQEKLHEFLSTPSARRATFFRNIGQTAKIYFYPRPPRGGRHDRKIYAVLYKLFLSTPSARRATMSTAGCRRL